MVDGLLLDVSDHVVVAGRKFSRLWLTGIWRRMIVGSHPITRMPIPTPFPFPIVGPVLPVVKFEVAARIPADVEIRIFDRGWDVSQLHGCT